ncbi:MAG TPA: rhomboid family intramembrane serine protease [Polyangiales bacterium]
MRLLRELAEETTAQRLVDALADQGIESELKGSDQRYSVWVIDEAHLPRAQALSATWLDGETRSAFEQSANRGMRARELSARIEERRQRHVEAMAQKLRQIARPKPTPLTWGLIALCIAVGVLTKLGEQRAMIASLTIADPRQPSPVSLLPLGGMVVPWLHLPWREPWRLVTPVLMHFGVIHILFNMLWLRDLGRIVEATHGARYLGTFILVCAAISNVAQYEIAQQSMFAGMSGVVYGLLAMVWLRGRLDPWIGYGLSTSTMQFMMIWFALGFVGNFGIANWCHMFGLLVGLGWAYVAHRVAAARAR